MRLDAPGEHPYAVVYHEYTHLLNRNATAWLPLWLNEGLAEFYQTTEIRDKEVLIGEPSEENRQILLRNQLLPLSTVLAVDRTSPYYNEGNKGSIFYAESWALTHYLTIKDSHENTNHLTDYVKLVSENVDTVTAATRTFGDLKLLQAALEQYIQQGIYYYSQSARSVEVDASAFKVQVLSVAQSDATRADFLAYNGRVADARSLLDEALRDDPKNPLAHQTMGYLEFRQGHLDEARKWYEQAVSLDSQSFLANYYFAAITMSRGQLNPESKSQIESSLRGAIKLNPSFAPAYDRLAVFYGAQRQNLEEAHWMILKAVELDPGNLSYWLHTANILLQMQRANDAVRVLQNAMSVAKTPEQITSVQNLLEEARRPPDTAKADGDRVVSGKQGAVYGGLEVLSDTMGVNFGPYLARVLHDVKMNWYNVIPQSAKAPVMKKGNVGIEFTILKDGSVGGMKLINSSGDVALDRAAWGGIANSNPFPPLPNEFGGKYLALRMKFLYNPEKASFR
jgi:TonB family protein